MKLKLISIFVLFVCGTHFAYAEDNLSKVKEVRPRVISLAEGIKIVSKDNRLIKIALPGNEMAYQDSLLARSALLPQFNANISQTFNMFQPAMKFNSSSVNMADKNALSYGIDVYQTLFDFGKSLSYWKASNELYKAQKAHTQSVVRVATLEFTIAYFDLLEAQRMIEVYTKEVESLSAYLSDIQHLYEQGVVVKNDLLPAKIRLADIKQKLIATRNNRQVASARLNNILGLSLREVVNVKDIKMAPPKFPDMQDAWDTAQALRPEVTFYNDQINSSVLSQRAKSVENFPTLFVDLGYSYAQNQYMVHQDNASVELGAKMNLYDGGVSRANLLKERFYQKKLTEQKDKIVEDIKLEIEDSYFGLKNACEKVAVATDALAQAQENVRFYRVKYQAGSATPSEVLDAITMQTKAQTNYYNDDYELKRTYAKLMYSIGIDLGLIYERMESEKNGTAN